MRRVGRLGGVGVRRSAENSSEADMRSAHGGVPRLASGGPVAVAKGVGAEIGAAFDDIGAWGGHRRSGRPGVSNDLPDIAGHVVKPETIGSEAADRRPALIAVIAGVAHGKQALPYIGAGGWI